MRIHLRWWLPRRLRKWLRRQFRSRSRRLLLWWLRLQLRLWSLRLPLLRLSELRLSWLRRPSLNLKSKRRSPLWWPSRLLRQRSRGQLNRLWPSLPFRLRKVNRLSRQLKRALRPMAALRHPHRLRSRLWLPLLSLRYRLCSRARWLCRRLDLVRCTRRRLRLRLPQRQRLVSTRAFSADGRSSIAAIRAVPPATRVVSGRVAALRSTKVRVAATSRPGLRARLGNFPISSRVRAHRVNFRAGLVPSIPLAQAL